MEFRKLEYIVSIAKHKSVGKAAKELYVSQPTLSKFVQTLESEIGQPLFSKIGNQFHLTYAGRRYVETAKHILVAKKRLDSELFDIQEKSVGELKIAFRMCGGINILPEVFPLFWEQYPRVKISLHESSSGNIEQDLINGDIDLAFITLPIKHPSIKYEVLSSEELVLVMSANHPLALKGQKKDLCKFPWIDLSDARDEKFILQQPSQKTRQVSDDLFRQYKISPDIFLIISNIEVAVQLVGEGYGLTFAGEVPLRQIQTSKQLAIFSVGNPCTEFTFAAAYKNGIYLSNGMRSFISICKSVLRKKEFQHT